jgi:hypothetical protein
MISSKQALVIVQDYRGSFYSSTSNKRPCCSMDISALREAFKDAGVATRLIGYHEVLFDEDWHGVKVLYQSAEDPGLQYRSYIEDVILGLSLAGARVIPRFELLRAHHNKVFLEILRKGCKGKFANTLGSQVFGTYEDFAKAPISYPCVLKTAYGAGSTGVRLARSEAQGKRIARSMSLSRQAVRGAMELFRRFSRRGYVRYSLNRKKFIVQEFVPNLQCDYKVMVFYDRIFILRRGVRPGDFRASGGGLFSWPSNPPSELLDMARELRREFNVPAISCDIAEGLDSWHLLEAQFVTYGPLTVEQSQWHWRWTGADWEKVEGTARYESVFAEAVVQYLDQGGL